MTAHRRFWFTAAALCLVIAASIFAGRTMLGDIFNDGLYKAMIMIAYLSLAGTAASLTKAFTTTEPDSRPKDSPH